MVEDGSFAMNRLLGSLLALVGLVALGAAIWWLVQPDPAEAEEAGGPGFVLPVTLARVETGELQPRAMLSGTVRSARRASLGFDADGIVSALEVDEADEVQAGALLARLADGDERLELAAAEAALVLAEREHELLLAGEREEEKRRLAAVLEAARAEAELARLEVERGEKLLGDQIISESEQDRRRTESRAAEKRVVAAEEEYARALAGTRAEDLAIAVARIAAARTRVDTAEHDLAKTRLTAPWDGAVIQRFLSTGDYVSAGDPVFELADLRHMEVHVEVPARFAPRVGDGSRARISLPGEEEVFLEAQLDARIQAADDRARSFRAIIRISDAENRGARLKPGMFVGLELALEAVPGALLVPSDSVLAGDRGRYLVCARDPSEPPAGGPPMLLAEFVPVKVLAEADGRSAVTSLGPPLSVGDAVVLAGADNAFPGASLLVREAAPGPGQAAADAAAPSGSAAAEVGRE